MSDILFYPSLVLLVLGCRWMGKAVYYGTAAVLVALHTLADLVAGNAMSSVVGAVATSYFAVLWWRNRRKGRGRRVAKQLGAKSRALVEALVENMTRSPIPSPAGGS